MPNDIFISQIGIQAANALSEEEKTAYGIKLTLSATALTKYRDEVTINAEVRAQGNKVTSADIPYYWFIEDASIRYSSLEYNQYGGIGWRCLNDYTVLSGDEDDESS
jgi:hypothetical protein